MHLRRRRPDAFDLDQDAIHRRTRNLGRFSHFYASEAPNPIDQSRELLAGEDEERPAFFSHTHGPEPLLTGPG